MNIIQKPSPNFDDRLGVESTILILHYTGMETAEAALTRLTDAAAKVSSHYTVDENGGVYQHVDEGDRAWHAGISSWQGETNINAMSIGVEIVNPGHEFGYREFPDTQIKAVQNLCQAIMARHEIEYVLAHSDVAPDRKQDPGELFPWKDFAGKGVGVWPEVSDEDIVKGAGLGVAQALQDVGYGTQDLEGAVIAFQRHYVPEVFRMGTEGQVCGLTRGRLYALLAGHVIGSD
jgi:N-acetylmuramoyl-L-alanine amidase